MQRLHRLLYALVGQFHRAPVMTGNVGRAAKLHAFDGLFRILMLRLHEPARFIGSERKIGEPERPMLFADSPVIPALVKTGIADMVDFSGRRLEDESRPERLATIPQTARRPVVARLAMEGDAGADRLVATPIHHRDPGIRHTRTNDCIIAEWGDEMRLVTALQYPKRFEIHVVVVIVGDQHDIDWWQVTHSDARRVHAFRTCKSEWARPFGPDRIGQDV